LALFPWEERLPTDLSDSSVLTGILQTNHVQAECEDLGGRVNNLTSENVALREEMNSLTEKVTLLVSDGKELRSQVQ
jgi:predicted nuclease with TOPRIM domain